MHQPAPVRQQPWFSQPAYTTPRGYQPLQVMQPRDPQASLHTLAYAEAQTPYRPSTAPQGQFTNSPEGGVGSVADDDDVFAPVKTARPHQYGKMIEAIVDQVDCFWNDYREDGDAMPELPDYVKSFLLAHATAADITKIKSVYERCEKDMAAKNAFQGPAHPKPIPLTEQPPANLSWQQKRLWYEQRGHYMPGDTTAPRHKARVPQQKQIKPRTYANKFPWKLFATGVKLNTCSQYMIITDRSRKPMLDGQGQIRRRSPRMPTSSLLMDEDENQHPCHYIYETFKPCPYPNDFQCHANHNFSKEMMIWLVKERNLPILTANRLINCAMKNKPRDMKCNMSPITQRDLNSEAPRGTMTDADIKAFWTTHTVRGVNQSSGSSETQASKPNETPQAWRPHHRGSRLKAHATKRQTLREAAAVKEKKG